MGLGHLVSAESRAAVRARGGCQPESRLEVSPTGREQLEHWKD